MLRTHAAASNRDVRSQARSSHILARVPLRLAIGDDPPVAATTADISPHGCLILSPVRVRRATVIWIQNDRTRAWAQADVIHASERNFEGAYEIGVEFVDDTQDFWGADYDEAW
jgi:PilZ domain-containing protein